MLRIGIIGVGLWGSTHLKKLLYFQKKGMIEISGINDVNTNRAREISREYNVLNIEIDKLLKNSDGVIIATPPSTHYKVASKIIEHGLDVLIEKPMTNNPIHAEKLVKLAEENGVNILVGYILRFNPAVKKLKELLRNGEIGDVVLIEAKRIGPRGKRVRDVGVILDLASHDIDVTRYILNMEPKEVMSFYGSLIGEYEDYAIIFLKYDMPIAIIQTNLLTPYKVRNVNITGSEGIIQVDYITQDVSIFKDDKIYRPDIKKEEPLIAELKHFINVIRGVEKPICDGYEGLKTLYIAYEALKAREAKRKLFL